MISISLCMIVKNEGNILARCLDSFRLVADEIIIVDTGSTDNTKDVAAQYTDKVYDFTWVNDFSAARNYAFSLATSDYIYSCDADEVLDSENLQRFLDLKSLLLPEIELVQMKYREATGAETTLNAQMEYRPKLFKRLRTFSWIDPIHETIRTEPVVFDSDIIIDHKPAGGHSQRDFATFQKAFERDHPLSTRIASMYAKELWRYGRTEDFADARNVYQHLMNSTLVPGSDPYLEACLILGKEAILDHRVSDFFKYMMKILLMNPCSECCMELGRYYMECKDYVEASVWFENAARETNPLLDIHSAGDQALVAWAESLEKCGLEDEAILRRQEARDWVLPIGD